jgi:hypothetical protein
VLPLYDNETTRDWLMILLLDLGIDRNDGVLRIIAETSNLPLRRITAYFDFKHARTIEVDSLRFDFLPGDSLRLFFSYRYTPSLLRAVMTRYDLEVNGEWVSPSGDEAVFLAVRGGGTERKANIA